MSGYPHGQGHSGYGAPPAQSYASSPYGATPPQGQQPYAPVANPYGAPSAPYGAPSAPYGHPGDNKPPKDKPQKQQQPHAIPSGAGGYPSSTAQPYGSPGGYPSSTAQPYGSPGGYTSSTAQPYGSSGGYTSSTAQSYGSPGGYPPSTAQPYGSPFASLVPSAFPPGTDPNVVACFQIADSDGSGFIDDKELQGALSSYNQSFSLRTVHLLMYLFTNSNTRKIGPKEFTAVFYSLQGWRGNFERFDRDRSGKIDSSELREALLSLGFAVSPMVLDLLVSKFDKTGGRNKAIEYDNFIECCLTVKGLTEKFKENDTTYSGSATFTYEAFMLTILPFVIA